MDFQRARSDEQKEIRIKQITKATLELYKTVKYEDITLAGIAKNLSFTRANLYKYISSKEEIFLYIIIEELIKWKDDLKNIFNNMENPDKETFATLWSESVYRNSMMIQTLSLLYTILEKNVPLDELVEFKKKLFTETGEVIGLLIKIFPKFTMETAFKFLQMQLYYAMGLYPTTNESEIQKKAIEIAGFHPFKTPDFIKELKLFTLIEFLKFKV